MDNFSYFLPLRFSISPFLTRFLIFGVLNFIWPRGAPFFDFFLQIHEYSADFFFTNEISNASPLSLIQGHYEIVKILLTQPAAPESRRRGWLICDFLDNSAKTWTKHNTNKKQNFEIVSRKNHGRKCHIWKLKTNNNEIWSSYIRLQIRHANNQNGSKVSKIARV